MSQRIKNNGFLAPELDVYARLTENQLLNRAHPEEGMFIAESPKVIERALDADAYRCLCLWKQNMFRGEAKRNDRKDAGIFRCIRQNLMC